MTKPRLLALLIACLIIVVVIFFLFRKLKPAPTPFAWQAHVVTLAGNGSPLVREAEQPTQAGFSDPFGIAIGSDGTVFISDAGESNRIRKLTPDGKMITVAGGVEGPAHA